MQKYAEWKSGAWCYLCKYSTHLNYCGTAARSLGSKYANLMFSLLAESTHARSMINPSKGGCLWGVTILAELPLMDAHQAAVFGPTHWVHVLLHSPRPGRLQALSVALACQACFPHTVLRWCLLLPPLSALFLIPLINCRDYKGLFVYCLHADNWLNNRNRNQNKYLHTVFFVLDPGAFFRFLTVPKQLQVPPHVC